MARYESDREDLLREATGLVERIELALDDFTASVVVGFRRGGAGSIFFGAAPVIQFNAQLEVRRGYRQGRLLKAETGRLVELSRERSPTQSLFVRHDLSVAEEAAVLTELGGWIDRLRTTLETGQWRVVGQVPDGADVLGRVRRWLAELPRPLRVAQRANVA